MTSFIRQFTDKGFLYQATGLEEIEKITSRQKIVAYVGFDCTAKSLHVGNLMQIMIMRLLQQCGHRPLIVIGGGTSKIGDPSGKTSVRKMLGDEQIEDNISGIKKSLSKFIDLDEAIVLNNASWLDDISYIKFLREFGSLISVNKMLTMESAAARLKAKQNLSFLEFNYMLLQAYDFYYLNKNYDCILQFGGSDQWGNIVTGTEIIGKLSKKQAYGITTPLLTTASGAKMGKTADGAVWLNEDMLSSYDYYQFWRNTDDRDVIRFAKFYCEFSPEKFAEFKSLTQNNINEAKKELALHLTELCHGKKAAKDAHDKASAIFAKSGNIALDSLDAFYIPANTILKGIALYELVHLAGFAGSKSDARRLIRGAGVKINDICELDENKPINDQILQKDSFIKLSAGKKKHILVKIKS